jgi:putative PIN family toxin of toxin-antitoxin system
MSPAPGAERLRVVLDTNIYIAAFAFPKGRNAVLWRAVRRGQYLLLTSPAIIRETARVLRTDFGWQDDRVQKVIRRIVEVAGSGVFTPRATLRAVTADPDDNRILECAVEGRADLIVSNDHHLLDLKSWTGIPIVAGVDFRRTLGLK